MVGFEGLLIGFVDLYIIVSVIFSIYLYIDYQQVVYNCCIGIRYFEIKYYSINVNFYFKFILKIK